MPSLTAKEQGNGNSPATDCEQTLSGAKPAGDATVSGQRSRKERLLQVFELCVVVLVAIGASSFHSVRSLFEETGYFWTSRSCVWLPLMVDSSGVLALLVYVLWRSEASRPRPVATQSLPLVRKVPLL